MNGESHGQPVGEEFEARVGDKSIRLRGRDPLHILIVLVILALTGVSSLMVYMLYDHKSEAKEVAGTFAAAVREQTAMTKQLVAVGIEQNCIMTARQEDRAARADECRRLSRMSNLPGQ